MPQTVHLPSMNCGWEHEDDDDDGDEDETLSLQINTMIVNCDHRSDLNKIVGQN